MPRPKYIDGIFNYCDRWCERCAFTGRCRTYAIEAEFKSRVAGGEDDVTAYFAALDKVLGNALEQAQKRAEELGVDFDVEVDPALVPADDREEVYSHPLAQAAEAYAKRIDAFCKANGEVPGDAGEVIRWYQHQIFVKLCRALDGRRDEADQDPEYLVDDDGKPYPKDSDGSAKVAILGIERSMSAWSTVRERCPSEAADFVLALARLRAAVDRIFPDARAFRRPGFDDGSKP